MLSVLRQLPNISSVGAASVAEAIQIIHVEPPDIAVLDIRLPDGNGLDVLHALTQVCRPACIILASAHVDEFHSTLERELQGIPNIHILHKPIRRDELLNLVRNSTASQLYGDSPFTASENLQLACMGRHSVRIECRDGDGVVGEIVVENGELWSARDAEGDGEDAFRRLIVSEAPHVTCHTISSVPPDERNIASNWQHLLLDAARIADEQAANSPDPHTAARVQSVATKMGSGMISLEEFEEFDRERFDRHMKAGAEAVLSSDLQQAYREFVRAESIHPGDPRVQSSLEQLRELGYS